MKLSGTGSGPEKINCPQCSRFQNCDVLATCERNFDGHGGTYKILECRGCNQVFYQTRSWNENDIDLDYDECDQILVDVNYSEAIYSATASNKFGEDMEKPSQSKGSKGGRPAAADWEALMIEIARALYLGDLKPRTQADIERAMMDFFAGGEKQPSETSIRNHARPLWRAIKDEANK